MASRKVLNEAVGLISMASFLFVFIELRQLRSLAILRFK